MVSDDPRVRYVVADGIATITFDRPEKLNALTFAMADAFEAAVRRADADPDVRVLVLRGEGDAFTTGVDVEDHLDEQDPAGKTLADDRADIARAAARWRALWDSPKPSIVRAHGWCAAWGLEIALHADIALATQDCRFFFPSVRNGGGLPDSAMVVHHVGPQWAKRLLVSGEIVDGATAARIGLVSESFASLEALDEAIAVMARRIAALPVALVARAKLVCNDAVAQRGLDEVQDTAELANALARRDPEVATFGEILRTQGRAAAIAWREARLR